MFQIIYPNVVRLTLAFMVVFFVTCSDEKETDGSRPYPSVDTRDVTDIDKSGATFHGEIMVTGTAGISDHGFVYDDAPNPQLETSDKISLGEIENKGAYLTRADRNLTVGKKYYVRAYATSKNKEFVVYGQEVQFESQGGSVPEFKDFFPKQAVIGDTIAFIGSGFSDIAANNSVSFQGQVTTVFKSTPDTLWSIVPATLLVGENELAVIFLKSALKHPTKFVLKKLSILTFTPAAAAFGDTITITGDNFPAKKALVETTVFERRQFVVSTNHTQIKVIVPPDAIATEAVLTVKAGSQTVASSEKLTLLKPLINDFTPLAGGSGTEVVIHGSHFNPIPVNNNVVLNGTPLKVLEASTTTLKVKIPTGISQGQYTFSITVTNQTVVSAGQFEIQ